MWSNLYFQHHNSSLQCHMIFRNHNNMLIYCSRNISDYYQCRKQLCCTISLWKLFIFQNSLINRHFKRVACVWNRNLSLHYKCLLSLLINLMCPYWIKWILISLKSNKCSVINWTLGHIKTLFVVWYLFCSRIHALNLKMKAESSRSRGRILKSWSSTSVNCRAPQRDSPQRTASSGSGTLTSTTRWSSSLLFLRHLVLTWDEHGKADVCFLGAESDGSGSPASAAEVERCSSGSQDWICLTRVSGDHDSSDLHKYCLAVCTAALFTVNAAPHKLISASALSLGHL